MLEACQIVKVLNALHRNLVVIAEIKNAIGNKIKMKEKKVSKGDT